MKLSFGSRAMIVIGLAFSIIVFTVPLITRSTRYKVAEAVSKNFKKIEFSLNLFFYTEGFELTDPSKVDVKTLVDRYYLKKNPGNYAIKWLDTDVEDDRRIVAVIYYVGHVDPVALKAVYPRVKWFDQKSGKLIGDYRKGLYPAVVVEVVKNW